MIDQTQVLATVTTPLEQIGTVYTQVIPNLLEELDNAVANIAKINACTDFYVDEDFLGNVVYRTEQNEEGNNLDGRGSLIYELNGWSMETELNLTTGVLTAERDSIKLSYQTEFNQDSDLFNALVEYFEQY